MTGRCAEPCSDCHDEELADVRWKLSELRSRYRRDLGKQDTALQLITATLEALMAECKRLLTPQGEDKPDLPITVPDSPNSKAKYYQQVSESWRKLRVRDQLQAEGEEILFQKGVTNPITGRVKSPNMTKAQAIEESRERLLKKGVKDPYATPAKVMLGKSGYAEVAVDEMVQQIVDSYIPEVETKGFLTSKGFFKQTKGKSFQPRKSKRNSPKSAGKKRAGGPKKKSITKRGKSRNTSKIPARGSSKFTKHSNKFQEYEDNHRDNDSLHEYGEFFNEE